MIKNVKKEMVHLINEMLPKMDVIVQEHQYKNLHIEEIGTGNINYIYRIKDEDHNSVIIKYAKEQARISKDMILSPTRNYWEAMVMKICKKYNVKHVPQIYYINSKEHYFIMEDLGDFFSLKDILAKGQIVPSFTNDIQTYFKKNIDKIPEILKELKKIVDIQENNRDLINLTESLVFEEPYFESLNNSYASNNKEYIYNKLYYDKELQIKVAKAKKIFQTQKTTLIHGDLHTGSIMILNAKDNMHMQVLDYEFAMLGPLSYDMGNILAHLTVSYICGMFRLDDVMPFLSWIQKVIRVLINLINQYKYLDNNYFMESSEMFCACELIRRSVGIAKFDEVHLVCSEHEVEIERVCIEIGRRLLLQPGLFQTAEKYIQKIGECIKESI